MGKIRLCILAAMVAAGCGFAQAVSITGKVTDSGNKALLGAILRMPGARLSAETDANGNYSLSSGAVGVVSPALMQQRAVPQPFFSAGKVCFNVPENGMHFKMSIFDCHGRFVRDLVNSTLASGNYSARVDAKALSSQFYLLRTEINGVTQYVTKLPPLLSGATSASTRTAASAGQPLRKEAAVMDTIVVAKAGYFPAKLAIETLTGTHDFTLQLSQNLTIDSANFWGDTSAIPKANNVMTYVFLNRTNGAFADSQVFWTFNGTTKTIAQQSTYDMPANSSGRVTFHLGTANSRYTDFIEHTINGNPVVWNGNTTRVDAWALPIAIWLHCGDGYNAILGEEYHIFYMNRDSVFSAFKNSVPVEFIHCATNGAPYKIIAPGKGDGGFGANQQYADYMLAYLTEIGHSGPTTEQVFACAGTPYGNNAQLAGATNRHVAQLPQAQWNDVSNFYRQAPANFYAQFLHANSFQHKCYGFAYDDSANQAAYASHANPKWLIIAIGY